MRVFRIFVGERSRLRIDSCATKQGGFGSTKENAQCSLTEDWEGEGGEWERGNQGVGKKKRASKIVDRSTSLSFLSSCQAIGLYVSDPYWTDQLLSKTNKINNHQCNGPLLFSHPSPPLAFTTSPPTGLTYFRTNTFLLLDNQILDRKLVMFLFTNQRKLHIFFKIRYQRSKSCIKMSSDCTLISDKNKMDCHYLHAPSCVQWRKREKMGVHPPIPPNCELLWCSICLAVPGSEFCSLRGRISSCVFPTKLQQTTTVFFSPGSF